MVSIGIHLPQLTPRPSTAAMRTAVDCAVAAERLGLDVVAVNDHVVYVSPWLDGPALLAAAAARTERIALATTVLLPVVRGAAAAASTLAAVHLLSGGRLTAGVGVGSHAADHAAVGAPFAGRGAALDTAVEEMRGRWASAGPPLWIASWGAPPGLRRVARLGDGWVASALAGGPEDFSRAWSRLRALLEAEGRDPETFGNLVATLFTYVTDDPREGAAVLRDRLAPALGRDPAALAARCAVGTAEDVAEHIAAFARAGAQAVLLWPADDPLAQVEAIARHVRPLLDAQRDPA
jgi:alkanesulfonate monooxygenase SsuD/methylene tetrahydromethanopterin reductase-like flavin-dependent oxidoreductase (luciferase family)